MDLKFGYERYVIPKERIGWLINMHPVSRSGDIGGAEMCMNGFFCKHSLKKVIHSVKWLIHERGSLAIPTLYPFTPLGRSGD